MSATVLQDLVAFSQVLLEAYFASSLCLSFLISKLSSDNLEMKACLEMSVVISKVDSMLF